VLMKFGMVTRMAWWKCQPEWERRECDVKGGKLTELAIMDLRDQGSRDRFERFWGILKRRWDRCLDFCPLENADTEYLRSCLDDADGLRVSKDSAM
jgi:hypothetical protein